MCGIAGIFHPDVPKPVDPARVEAMADALAHRGPDGSGVWTAPGVGLGHRRLSIIDLARAAPSRCSRPTAAMAISYNGEIYNFREVRAELEALGPRLPHRERHRGDPRRLAAMGAGLPGAVQRHVRLRALRRGQRLRSSSPATGSA